MALIPLKLIDYIDRDMKIAVLLSGGVDSSVALHLLKMQGYSVTAFYLKIWLEDELSYLGDCPWEQDLSYAQAVCKKLNVPLEVISLQKEYWDEVVAYVVKEVKKGHTPNPDIMCNKRIKFGHFLTILGDSFDYVATGHYAQRRDSEIGVQLLSSPDEVKDQTYFLAHITRDQLAKIMFPIGHLTKNEVRQLAHDYGMPNKTRKDSQGICFLGTISFRDFIKHHLGQKQGNIVEIESGKQVGKHEGFWFYTVGQRRGLRLAGGPWYVVKKDIQDNVVYVSRHYHEEEKERNHFSVDNMNWFVDNALQNDNLFVKLRHGPHKNMCTVYFDESSKRLQVTLTDRDQGIAPGQFAVFYLRNQCLGGGVIQ